MLIYKDLLATVPDTNTQAVDCQTVDEILNVGTQILLTAGGRFFKSGLR
jgi:hypothetical protein